MKIRKMKAFDALQKVLAAGNTEQQGIWTSPALEDGHSPRAMAEAVEHMFGPSDCYSGIVHGTVYLYSYDEKLPDTQPDALICPDAETRIYLYKIEA